MKRIPLRGLLAVLVVATLANILALAGTNAKSAGDGDGPFYIGIARSLAAGQGYVLGDSPWPDKPTMGRAPVWPALLTLPAFLAPHASDDALLRVTAACLNVVSALFFFAITWRLTGGEKTAIAAGVGYAIYPVALALAAGGFSEIPYVFIAALGILLILTGGRSIYLGVLILGLAPLVRSNFIALPVMAAVAAIFTKPAFSVRRFAILAALFWLPSMLWIVRNYRLSGEFPVLSTIEGETLYGANNTHVATALADWGYWVFPDDIPGETRKKQLALTMNERQLDRYYHAKGIAFLKQHWFELPRLEVGRLIRAFVPVPWVANGVTYVVFFFRGVLYLGILLSLRKLCATDSVYRTIVTAMFLVVLVTVLIYYGTYRFTFCAEVFMLPVIAARIFGSAPQRAALP